MAITLYHDTVITVFPLHKITVEIKLDPVLLVSRKMFLACVAMFMIVVEYHIFTSDETKTLRISDLIAHALWTMISITDIFLYYTFAVILYYSSPVLVCSSLNYYWWLYYSSQIFMQSLLNYQWWYRMFFTKLLLMIILHFTNLYALFTKLSMMISNGKRMMNKAWSKVWTSETQLLIFIFRLWDIMLKAYIVWINWIYSRMSNSGEENCLLPGCHKSGKHDLFKIRGVNKLLECANDRRDIDTYQKMKAILDTRGEQMSVKVHTKVFFLHTPLKNIFRNVQNGRENQWIGTEQWLGLEGHMWKTSTLNNNAYFMPSRANLWTQTILIGGIESCSVMLNGLTGKGNLLGLHWKISY